MLYNAESEGKLFSIGPGQWMESLRPYYSDVDKILACPSAIKPCQDLDITEARGSVDTMWGRKGQKTEWGGRVEGYWGSYGHNSYASYTYSGDSRSWGRFNVSGVQDIPVFADSAFVHAVPRYTDPIPPEPLTVYSDIPVNASGCQIWRFCIDRHEGNINICFLDSAVRKVMLYSLWDLKWSRDWIPQGYTRADMPWLK